MGERLQRYAALLLLLSFGFGLLGFQLVRLQLWMGPELRSRAVRQQGQALVLNTPRGGIYDRNQVSLLASQWQPVLGVFPSLVTDKNATARELAAFLGQEYQDICSSLEKGKPFLLEVNRIVPALEVFAAGSFPGVYLLQREQRYGESALAQHLIGYVQGEKSLGVAGLERHYNSHLQKGQGLDLVAWVDANGSIIPGLGFQQVPRGKAGQGELLLTIDARIQRIVEEVMDQRIEAGAVIVVQVRTGEILALASRPNFRQDKVEEYLENTDACLVNRSFRNYPPGSLFKIIVSAAALEEGLTGLEEEFQCKGFLEVGEEIFRCHHYSEGGHGTLALTEAFAESCNPVFITLAQRLGAGKLLNYARRLGLGSAVLNLPEEMQGHLPDTVAYLGDLANISLGQGPVLVTPLQMAQVTQTVANGGILLPLQLVHSGPIGKQAAPGGRRVLSTTTVTDLHAVFRETVSNGTGTEAALPWWSCGGKTGTAETGNEDEEGKVVNHAWFAGFAPLEAPMLAAVVLVEEGGSGGKVAAPVFSEVMGRIIAEVPVTEYN